MLLRFRGRDSTDEQTSSRADEPRGPGKKCDNNKIKSNQEEIPPPTDPNGPLAGRRMSCAESSSHSVVIQDQAGVTDTSSCNPPQVANSRKSRQEPTRRSPAAWCKPPTGGAGGRVLAAVPAAVPQLWLPPNTDCLLHGKPKACRVVYKHRLRVMLYSAAYPPPPKDCKHHRLRACGCRPRVSDLQPVGCHSYLCGPVAGELRMCGWGPYAREASVWGACCWCSGVINMS